MSLAVAESVVTHDNVEKKVAKKNLKKNSSNANVSDNAPKRKRMNRKDITTKKVEGGVGNDAEKVAIPAAANATDILKASLLKFFENRENIERFLPIINRTSPVSLRLLDYFCVNYSRSTQVVYMITDKYFDVHSSYKNQLKTFSKKRFDPFKRNNRMTIRCDNNKRFDTTVGQLCFFKWCLTHNVLDYVEKNIADISEDMKKNLGKTAEELNAPPSEKKRRSTNRKSSSQMAATRVPTPPGTDTIIVSFDD